MSGEEDTVGGAAAATEPEGSAAAEGSSREPAEAEVDADDVLAEATSS